MHATVQGLAHVYENQDRWSPTDHVAMLLRRRWLILGICLVTIASGLIFSLLQTAEYRADTEVAVEPFQPAEDASLEEVILGDVAVNTQRQIVTSRAVTDRVLADLDLQASAGELLEQVTVSVVPDTRVLTITVIDTDATRAADIANAYATTYLQQRREQAVDSLLAAQATLEERQEAIRQQIDDVERQLDQLQEPEPGIDDETGEPTGEVDDPDEAQRALLESERASLQTQLSQLASQVGRTEADAEVIKGGGQVLNPAEPVEDPVSPQPVRTGLLALVLGLMLGVGVALVRDHFDDLIRDEEDAKRAARDLPILGRIPMEEPNRKRLVTLVEPSAPQAEAYRALSAAVRFLLAANEDRGFGPDAAEEHVQPGQTVLVTSPDPGDGKTSTAANLAVAAARADKRVVLVGADMRRPKIHRRFGLPAGVGLSDVIAGEVSVRDALVEVGVDNLLVLPAGTVPPNPTELLAAPRMRALDSFLSRGADLVVIDAPPVLAVADALEMAPYADSILLVVRAGQSRRRNLHHALERLHGVGAAVSGLVVNHLDEKSAAYAYYTQDYQDPDARPADLGRADRWPVSTPPGDLVRGNGNGRSDDDLSDPTQLFPVGQDH